MGKGLLIIVLGMSVIISFFILKLNANSKENLSTTVNMFEQTQARLIANSGVEIYLEKLKADKTMNGNTYLNNSLFGGDYDLTMVGPDSLVRVTSTANFMGVTHTTVVEAQTDKLPVFPIPAAMYIASETVSGAKINGNITISGYDHDINGNILNNGNDLLGIAVDNPADVPTILSNIGGSATVEGTGGNPSVNAVTNAIDWEAYAEDVANNPDIVITSATDFAKYTNLGTTTDPKTTFINGNIQISNDLTGCGIMVVNGNLKINDLFTYRGIIIAYKDSEIRTELNGEANLYGGMIIAGKSAELWISNGTFDLFYSQEALQTVAQLLKTRRFNIVSWYE